MDVSGGKWVRTGDNGGSLGGSSEMPQSYVEKNWSSGQSEEGESWRYGSSQAQKKIAMAEVNTALKSINTASTNKG